MSKASIKEEIIIHETEGFQKDLKKLPKDKIKKFQKQIKTLATDFFYPSLRTKKVKGFHNIWEARIDYHFRFSFWKDNKQIYLISIGPHDAGIGQK